jgi:aldose 1-epimerase
MVMLRLQAGPAVAEVAPEQGGGLAGLWVDGVPALSAQEGRPGDSPFALAMNLLLPFSNRISRPFAFKGRVHALAPNLEGEPFPIHGDAFQRRWTVLRQDEAGAVLRLEEGSFGPYRYAAEVAYHLTEGAFEARLALTSRAEEPLPYGIGFHPWFPRTSATRVRLIATGCWPQDDRHLPTTEAPAPIPPDWDFATAAPLPAGWINAAFSGWNGTADVVQGPEALSLSISAPDLSTLIVYSPSDASPFLCLEPVSNPVDAHNLPGQPGLVRLEPGEGLSASMVLAWHAPACDAPAQDASPAL